MKQINAKILKNEEVAARFYKISVESLYLAKNSKPGQFVEVRCSNGTEPLLRRPLGVHRISRQGIEMLYEVVGKGTEILSERKPGEMLDVIGPLGNGFDLNPQTRKPANPQIILVAGGIGVAPLLGLAEHLGSRVGILVLIGACKKEHVLCEKEFNKLGAKVLVATEDGSRGHKGLVTDLLNIKLKTNNQKLTTIYACGPTGMLKAVSRIAEDNNIPCQVSLEEHMACGVGVCLGCPVKLKSQEYKMVCKDGPVFNAEEIAW